ncbi:SusC/RagA family TonB-linked outer membrane protein [Pedobacter miscanthi]|uniref:SusC/RagA family TonB-linked outer membrane protein n=1 Tax=Pedobacter miscanthi TaxID=2259170 RepID=A0A366L1X7_9SPHI|nr:TonB-dependent receptor [Pedobacter miscanthi]RBQ07885.1 SusC/RagA family TonB-linked outer membrane protein [Pedobacter miscanthi]
MKKQLFLLLACCIATFTYAQNIAVKGKVTDAKGGPLIGVVVKVKGSTGGTSSGTDGGFSISAPNGAILIFSYVGFESKEIKVPGNGSVNITLSENNNALGEVVVVGYGTQKKATLTGSVSSVSNAEISTTKTQNLQNMLTGKIPGLRVVQRTSEPGVFNNQFDIRGFGNPLVIIDGVPRDNITRLDPNEIESVSVLKDAAAAVYGVRAANGVVLVTTKKGKSGRPEITYSGFYGTQTPIGLPKPVGVIDRFTLMNEKSMHKVDGPILTYNDDDFAPYLNGTKIGTDWYDATMRDYSPQYQQNLSVSGSSADRSIDYFINLGYAKQGGIWKSNSLNYDRYNLRSNLNAQISKRLKASLKLNGILEKKMNPKVPSWQLFSQLWRAQPNELFFANNNPDYLNKLAFEHPTANSDSEISGYQKDENNWLQSQFSLDYQVPFIEGLTARGMFSYDAKINNNTDYAKSYSVYDYNAASNTYAATTKNGPDQLRRSFNTTPNSLMQLSLNYVKSIQKHNVNALVLYEESNSTADNFFAQRELALPLEYLFAGKSKNQLANTNQNGVSKFATKALVGRLNYDYAGKYLGEFSFRYDGSSRFSKKDQFGFFPGGSVGWRISEEPFMKNSSSLAFINNLKIRASYGKMGDDGSVAYQFLSGYNYPFAGNLQALGGGYIFNDEFINSVGFRAVPNPDLTWVEVNTTNIGLDADLWKGKLGITFEAFKRSRTGLLDNRLVTVPGSFGANMPQENLNSDETRGLELALTHKNKIGALGYNISGNVGLTRTRIIYDEQARAGNSQLNWRNSTLNRYNDVWFGFGYLGQFQSFQQIATYNQFTGRGTLPGDYIYEDWNGDGTFDDADRHPIATAINPNSTSADGDGARHNYPLLNFGLNIGLDYKGFDLNLLFQGAAMSYVSFPEALKEPLAFDGNALELFLDRWHPVDPKADPYNPANQWIQGYYAYTGTVINENSRRSIQNGAYLRLKSAELGYSLPKAMLQKIGVQAVRVYVNGYNLFTLTKVKGLDPERPSELYGYMYPINRTINFGTSISF